MTRIDGPPPTGGTSHIGGAPFSNNPDVNKAAEEVKNLTQLKIQQLTAEGNTGRIAVIQQMEMQTLYDLEQLANSGQMSSIIKNECDAKVQSYANYLGISNTDSSSSNSPIVNVAKAEVSQLSNDAIARLESSGDTEAIALIEQKTIETNAQLDDLARSGKSESQIEGEKNLIMAKFNHFINEHS